MSQLMYLIAHILRIKSDKNPLSSILLSGGFFVTFSKVFQSHPQLLAQPQSKHTALFRQARLPRRAVEGRKHQNIVVVISNRVNVLCINRIKFCKLCNPSCLGSIG